MPGNSQLIFIVAIIGVFYFIVIRPQQKRAKTQREMLASLKPGSEIVTIGGIYATVVSVGERIRVALADGTEMEVAKQAVGQVLPADASAVEAEPESDETLEGDDDESEAPADADEAVEDADRQ